MADPVNPNQQNVPNQQADDTGVNLDPLARTIDPRGREITGLIMSTPGQKPVWEGVDLSVANTVTTFGEVGTSGLRIFSGWVKEEILQELQGRQGSQKYREMGDNSPTIGAILYAIQSTFRKVEWRVTPSEEVGAGQAQQAADFVESCMNDMSHSWEDFMIEVLSCLQYGFAFHEIVYKRRLGRDPPKIDPDGKGPLQLAHSDYDDGLIGWRRMPIRGQDTILSWFMDNHGTITGVRQLPWTGLMRDIPIEKGMLFRPTMHKNNPEGRSILRTAYIPYYFVKRLNEQEAIMGERMGGVPVVSVPSVVIEAANKGDPKATATMNSFKNLAVNLRIDEQMGVVIPSDVYQGANGPSSARMYQLELITPQGGRGGTMNFEAAIGRHNISIMTSVLADFLTLGHEARGTQSLAVTKVDLFFQAVEGYLNSFAAVFNKYALPRLFKLNGMDLNAMPKIEPDLAQRVDLDVLSNFVLRLSQAGMPMFPNDDLQSFLLDAGGLPDIQDPRALQAAGLTDDQLDLQDEQAEAELDQTKNPPQPASNKPPVKKLTNLDRMLLGSLQSRITRMQGPRFGVTTKKRRKKAGHGGSGKQL